MARFLIYSDVHFSEYSSIIRSQGKEFSTRLENMINTLNWAENYAIQTGCDEVLCLGDFFDKPDLNSRELTALQRIKWANIPHTFLVGNHEASNRSLKYNSVTALQNNGFHIVDKPELKVGFMYEILMLPYIMEDDRKSLDDYWKETCKGLIMTSEVKIPFIISHNDIKGLQYGSFISKEGFDIDDISKDCRLFLNGHLHNGEKFCNNGMNIGNLTGQNFNENAEKYDHGLFILDTQEITLEFVENPYAFNFYKIECNTSSDIEKLKHLKSNAVVSIKCVENLIDEVKEIISNQSNIIEKRLIVNRNNDNIEINNNELLASDSDHLTKFIQFCKERINNSDILNTELLEVCK